MKKLVISVATATVLLLAGCTQGPPSDTSSTDATATRSSSPAPHTSSSVKVYKFGETAKLKDGVEITVDSPGFVKSTDGIEYVQIKRTTKNTTSGEISNTLFEYGGRSLTYGNPRKNPDPVEPNLASEPKSFYGSLLPGESGIDYFYYEVPHDTPVRVSVGNSLQDDSVYFEGTPPNKTGAGAGAEDEQSTQKQSAPDPAPTETSTAPDTTSSIYIERCTQGGYYSPAAQQACMDYEAGRITETELSQYPAYQAPATDADRCDPDRPKSSGEEQSCWLESQQAQSGAPDSESNVTGWGAEGDAAINKFINAGGKCFQESDGLVTSAELEWVKMYCSANRDTILENRD